MAIRTPPFVHWCSYRSSLPHRAICRTVNNDIIYLHHKDKDLPKLLQSDGDLDPIGGLGRVESDVRARHYEQ